MQNFNLHCGDSLEYLRSLPDKSIDLIVTDPPYLLETGGVGGFFAGKNIKSKQALNDIRNQGFGDSYDLESYNTEFIRVMKSINIYIWCNKLQIFDYMKFYNKYNCKFELLIWNKTNPLPLFNHKYLTDCEYCLYFRNSNTLNPESYENAKTIYTSPLNTKDKKLYKHPTIKPLDFIKTMIKNSSKVSDSVLDPFMGSGTTGVACRDLNRKFTGIEIIPEYYEIAKSRIFKDSNNIIW